MKLAPDKPEPVVQGFDNELLGKSVLVGCRLRLAARGVAVVSWLLSIRLIYKTLTGLHAIVSRTLVPQ